MTRRTALSRSTIAVVAGLSLSLGIFAAYAWNATNGNSDTGVPPASAAVTGEPTPSPSPTPTTPQPTPTAVEFNKELHSIDQSSSLWVVVNKARPLDPPTYEPSALHELAGIPGGAGQHLVPEAAAALAELYERIEAEGLPLRVATAYRSHEYQSEIFDEYVAVWGRAHTESLVARPGHTEHQTGLAVDLFAADECRIKECFEDEATYEWLVGHAAEFGFIERYPAGAHEVTGYQYEPWHWRYVGVELAAELTEQRVATLEEFFGLPPAPEYLD